MKQSNQPLSELDNDRVQDLPAVRSNPESDAQRSIPYAQNPIYIKEIVKKLSANAGVTRVAYTGSPPKIGMEPALGVRFCPDCSGHLPIDDRSLTVSEATFNARIRDWATG